MIIKYMQYFVREYIYIILCIDKLLENKFFKI